MQPISLALSAGSTISSVSHQHKVGFMCVTWSVASLRDIIRPGPWTVYALRATRCASRHQSCAFPLQEYDWSPYKTFPNAIKDREKVTRCTLSTIDTAAHVLYGKMSEKKKIRLDCQDSFTVHSHGQTVTQHGNAKPCRPALHCNRNVIWMRIYTPQNKHSDLNLIVYHFSFR